jgi:hypothetical protein
VVSPPAPREASSALSWVWRGCPSHHPRLPQHQSWRAAASAAELQALGRQAADEAEGTDPTGGGLYYERNSNQHRRLQAFETGSEDFMTGGWVRVLATAEQVRKERPGMERASKAGLVKIHGTHRGVLLVEFLDVPWG